MRVSNPLGAAMDVLNVDVSTMRLPGHGVLRAGVIVGDEREKPIAVHLVTALGARGPVGGGEMVERTAKAGPSRE